MLAGRLGPDNVRAAIDAVRPWAVDAASRLESEPGIKDHAKRARLRGGGAVLTYGAYGGRFVPETLIPALDELEQAWNEAKDDPAFALELDELGRSFGGRPTPLMLAERFAPDKRLYLKREDLLHTGAHKLNNALGQALLARRLGKRRIVAETGAGQHGVAAATVCAKLRPRVRRLHGRRGHGAASARTSSGCTCSAPRSCPSSIGTKTLREATSEAIRDWIANVETTHYLIGSCVGPHPYPELVRELQAVIGREARAQIARRRGPASRRSDRVRRRRLERNRALRRLPRRRRRAGRGRGGERRQPRLRPGRRAARRALLAARRRGRPGAGRRVDLGRASTTPGSDRSTRSCATPAGRDTCRRPTRRRSPPSAGSRETEGILPALEPAHALARVADLDAELVVVCLSGRGDKDLATCLTSRRRPLVFPAEGIRLGGSSVPAADGGGRRPVIAPAFQDPDVGGRANMPTLDETTLLSLVAEAAERMEQGVFLRARRRRRGDGRDTRRLQSPPDRPASGPGRDRLLVIPGRARPRNRHAHCPVPRRARVLARLRAHRGPRVRRQSRVRARPRARRLHARRRPALASPSSGRPGQHDPLLAAPRRMKTLVVYLMAGRGHAGARRGRGRGRRRHRRARVSLLRPARRRAGDPQGRRAGARRRDAHPPLPRVPGARRARASTCR